MSHLRIPGYERPWEGPESRPGRIASPLAIMIEGPIGAASFNNEFGRPNLCGYFRTFEQEVAGTTRGYHKPIMIAGGVGAVRDRHAHKADIPAGALLIQLGGPGMLIGMGGGTASSMATGANTADLDFDSVQRGNAEIQRRAQEVIDRCWALGDRNPLLSIHDVGAGGLSNALPELAHGAGRGAKIDLRAAPNEKPGMSPREVWSNEAQERYVLAIAPDQLEAFTAICARERCHFAVVGVATDDHHLEVRDPLFGNLPVDMDLPALLGKPPRMMRDAGITRVRSLEELAGTALAFPLPPVRGRRLFILGGGGGDSVYYADICNRLGLQVPALEGETREKLNALIPAVGSFARNPVDAWRAFHDPPFMAKILELAFEDPGVDLIVVDRLIPRPTYAQPEERDTSEAAIDYLRENRFRKPLVAVVDGSGEDPFLANEATRLRRRLCQAGIPAYASLPLAAQALTHLAAYSERMAGRPVREDSPISPISGLRQRSNCSWPYP